MVDFIRNDDSKHMVSTSAGSNRYPLISDPMFDYINMHSYFDYKNPKMIVHEAFLAYPDYNSPIMVEESGMDWRGPILDLVPQHHRIWGGLMSNTPATAMNWWWEKWDAYMGDTEDKYYSYRNFVPASNFCSRIPRNVKGTRWMTRERLACNDSRVDIVGYNGKDFAFLWMYDLSYKSEKDKPETITDITFKIMLDNGTYTVEWFNTWNNHYFKVDEINVKGNLTTITTPSWNRDIAIAITQKGKEY